MNKETPVEGPRAGGQQAVQDGLRQFLLKRILPLFRLKDPRYDPWWWPSPFCRFTIARNVHIPGVYVLTVDGQTMYVGKCRDLGERFGPQGYGAIQPRNCFVAGQSTNCKINNLVLQHAKQGQVIELWFHATDEAPSVERDLIVRARTPWNGQVPW